MKGVPMKEKIVIKNASNSFCSAEVGTDDRVYIKCEQRNDNPVWSIYSPEGEKMAETFSRETAIALVRQNDLRATQVN